MKKLLLIGGLVITSFLCSRNLLEDAQVSILGKRSYEVSDIGTQMTFPPPPPPKQQKIERGNSSVAPEIFLLLHTLNK